MEYHIAIIIKKRTPGTCKNTGKSYQNSTERNKARRKGLDANWFTYIQ